MANSTQGITWIHDEVQGLEFTGQLFSDGSGFSAVVSIGTYKIAYNFVKGEVCRNVISRPTGYVSRQAQKKYLGQSERAYRALLAKHTDRDWMDRHDALYAD